MQSLSPIRVAIFGGTGFIGRTLGAAIRQRGGAVLVLSRGAPDDGEHSRTCDAAQPIDPSLLEGVDVVVNLVGIKAPQRARGRRQQFEDAHVTATRHIVGACEAAGISRLLHVSVARDADEELTAAASPYLKTKARGEEVIRESGLEWTILRPGIVWGEGDDFLTNLVAGVRFGPLFATPRPGTARIQPIHVDDVALAIVACLRDEATHEKILDLVGPERAPLSTFIERIAIALGLSTRVIRLPAPLMKLGASVMESLSHRPPVTRGQLDLLRRGVLGRADVAENILGRTPRALSVEALTLAEARGHMPTGSMFGFSLRAVRDRRTLAPVGQLSHRAHHLRWFVPLVVAVMLATGFGLRDQPMILRVLTAYALLFTPAAWLLRGTVRYLVTPSLRRTVWALLGVVVMYVGGWGVLNLIELVTPEAAAQQLQTIRAALDAAPLPATLAGLVVGVLAEEFVFRGTILMPMLAMNRPAAGIFISAGVFCVAHLSMGPPLLVFAALCAGLCWAWLAARTRSLFAPLVCHLGWDALVLWGLPYT